MGIYQYIAYDNRGNRSISQVEAANQGQAREKILASGLVPVEINFSKEWKGLSFRNIRYLFFKNPSLRDIEYFVSELSILLKNGIRLNRALDMVSGNIEHPGLKKAVLKILQGVRGGNSLYESMKAYPGYFDRMVLNLVDLGERTGKLGELFQEIARHVKFRYQMRGKVVQSLTYPIFIISICFFALLFIFNYIVPRLANIFTGIEALPFYTSLLLETSGFFRQYQWYVLPALFLLPFILIRLGGRFDLSGFKDRLLLWLPMLRSVNGEAERLKFSNAMHILLRNQVQLDRSLYLAVSSINNRLIRERISSVVQGVKAGQACSGALSATGFFPPFFINLVEIGEETGNLAEVFGEISGELQRKFGDTVQRLITFIEPLAIIITAIIVGTIIVTVMLSIVSVHEIPL